MDTNCGVKRKLFFCFLVTLFAVDSKANVISRFRYERGCEHGSHWSEWVDRNSPGAMHVGEVVNGDPEYLSMAELKDFCHGGRITAVDCTSSSGNPGQNITCSVENGVVCKNEDNAPSGCNNYRVRYFCDCKVAVDRARIARAALSLPAECNSWTPWINNHHPNDSANFNDVEAVTQTDLQAYCPLDRGASITKHRCKDQKGEPFQGFKTMPTFNVSCEESGYVCTPKSGEKCADIQIRYYCQCPTQLGLSTISLTIASTASTTNVMSSPTTTNMQSYPSDTNMHSSSSTTDLQSSPSITIKPSSHSTMDMPGSPSNVNMPSPSTTANLPGLPPSTNLPGSQTTTLGSVWKKDELQEWPINQEEVSVFGTTVSVCVLVMVLCAALTLCHCCVNIYTYRALAKKLRKRKPRATATVFPELDIGHFHRKSIC